MSLKLAMTVLTLASIFVGDLEVPEIVNREPVSKVGTIFVGDSRTVGMSKAVEASDDEFYVAKVGKGYKWFIEDGYNQVETIVDTNTDYTDWNIVLNLGVNDLGNVDKYKKKYDDLMKTDWKDFDVYIVSVNPVDESKCTTVNNLGIEKFNDVFEGYEKYIDSYELVDECMSTKDGLHYSNSTYQRLHEYLIKCIS